MRECVNAENDDWIKHVSAREQPINITRLRQSFH